MQRELRFYNQYETVYQLDSISCSGFALLTLYHKDESGFHNLYYLTLSTSTGKLLSWAPVATWGSDGGWEGSCTLQHTNSKLRVTTLNDWDAEEPEIAPARDSLVMLYELTATGQLHRTLADSTRRMLKKRNTL